MRTLLAAMVATGALVLGGCGKTEPPPPPPTPKAQPEAAKPAESPKPVEVAATPAPLPTPAETNAEPATQPKSSMKQWPRPERKTADKALDDPATPEELVQQLSKAVADGKYQALWEVLPPKHQAQVVEIIKEFADNADPIYYDQMVSTVELMTKSLERHKDRFFSLSVADELPIEKEKLQKAWNPLTDLGKAMLDSEIYDLAELKTVDVPSFLAATMPRVVSILPSLVELEIIPLGQLKEYFGLVDSLKAVKATRVSGDGDKAVVKIEAEGHDPHEVEFVRIEGKWVPSQLEQQWPTVIQQMRDFVALLPDKRKPEATQQLKGMILGIWFTAGGIYNAKTDKDLENLIRAMLKYMPKQDAATGDAKSNKKNADPKAEPNTNSEKPSEKPKP